MTYRFSSIRELRLHVGVHQDRMADLMGLSVRTLTKIESLAFDLLDVKTLRLLALASLDLAIEKSDTTLALPYIAQRAEQLLALKRRK